MEQFNFKSAICTSAEQSRKLLSLGLKKETADCYWWQENDQYGDGNGKWHLEVLDTKEAREHFEYLDKIFDDELFIPAWSLHRLIEMMPMSLVEDKRYHECWDLNVTPIAVIYRNQDEEDEWIGECMGRGLYNNIIDCIEWLIKEGYFNKEYLV